jgi:DNA-binding MarR family transcriptional regulator
MRYDEKAQVLSRLLNARNALTDVLTLTASRARYDAEVLRDGTRKEISAMVDDLNRLLGQLQTVH